MIDKQVKIKCTLTRWGGTVVFNVGKLADPLGLEAGKEYELTISEGE